jgi:hypothetical protein
MPHCTMNLRGGRCGQCWSCGLGGITAADVTSRRADRMVSREAAVRVRARRRMARGPESEGVDSPRDGAVDSAIREISCLDQLFKAPAHRENESGCKLTR